MKTVLLVDDDASLRILVRTTLEGPACRVVEAHDGKLALAIARREAPDLILLDWMMPGLSGLETLELLRREDATSRTPVIMLTARGRPQDREQALAAGCQQFLVKPFSPLELLGLVREILQRAPTPDAAPAPSAPPETLTRLAQVDPQLALYVRDLRLAVAQESLRAQELADANARLATLNRLKTDFLAYVSHELRTPLNAISAVEILEPDAAESERGELIEIVRDGYERLREFIEQGLEQFEWLGRDHAGADGSADLARIVADAAASIAGLRAPRGRLELRGLDTPCVVRGESAALTRVVRIMLENAIEFSSPERDIVAELRIEGARAAFSVSDQGAGPSTPNVQRAFQQLASGGREGSDGSGLNFALARVIVEASGGAIRAQSEGPGRGATFVVELPLSSRALAARAPDVASVASVAQPA